MKRLFLIFVFLGATARAATGDILSATVAASGVRATIRVEGFTTGCTYSLGTSPANYKITFTVVSKGYTGTTLGTVTRTVYGHFVTYKEAPPANSYARQETVSGSDLDIEIALSEPIYAKDNTGVGNSGTAPTVNIVAGFATNTGGGAQTSAATTALAVTNNSTLAYGLASARWICAPKERLTSLALPLEAVAFHAHGIAAVEFSAADEHSHTVAASVTAMTVASTYGNPPCYATTLDLTGFTSGDIVTANLKAYPVVGDTATDSSGTSFPNEALCAWPFLLDSAGSFGVTVCYVDTASGSSSNSAYDVANDATARANPVDTIATAWNKIAAFNNSNRSRNNVDGGIVYLLNGNPLTGTTSSPPASAKAWCIVTPASGVSSAAVAITGYSASGRYLPKYTKFLGVTFTPSTAANQLMFFGATATDCPLWQGCTFTGYDRTSNTNYISGASGFALWIGNTVVDYRNGMSGASMTPLLHRGNSVRDANSSIASVSRCLISNSYTGVNGTTDALWQTPADITNGNVIIAYNQAYHLKTSAFSTDKACPRLTIVGNVIEIVGTTISPAFMVNDNSYADVIVWHNTVVGQRVNLLNDITNPLVDKTATRWSVKFNAFKSLNVAQHSDDTADTLVGWRAVQYATGLSGNVARTTIAPGYTLGAYSADTITVDYVTDASKEGTDAGSGDYHPTATSALRNRIPANGRLLPFDLTGRAIPNDGTGASGAYQYPVTASPLGYWW